MKRLFWVVGIGFFAVGGLASRPGAEILTVPTGFGNVRAFPNPWRSNQHSAYPVRFDGFPTSAVTTLRIFTISGELVRTLTGVQQIPWDLRNSTGDRVASGIYIYLLNANNEQRSGKIAVIR